MKQVIFLMLLTASFSIIVSQTEASIVIGGSTLESPPPFWENSYWGMTSGLQRAFPFTTISGGPFYAETLQVAAFYYSIHSGFHARFTIHLNNSGIPGETIGTFETSNIPRRQWPGTYIPQVINVQTTEEIVLNPNTSYWLVGQTLQQTFNWHLADNVFGTVAYREGQGEWVFLQYSNLSAFAILGTTVPESCTILLLGVGGLLIRKR